MSPEGQTPRGAIYTRRYRGVGQDKRPNDQLEAKLPL